MSKEKLKIGVLINDSKIESWIFRVLEKLTSVEYCELVILSGTNTGDSKISSRKKSFILKLHEKIDGYLYRGRYDYSVNRNYTDLDGKDRHVSFYNWDRQTEHINITFAENSLDLILSFQPQDINTAIVKLSKNGVVIFNTNNNWGSECNYTAYQEIVNRDPEIRCFIKLRKVGEPEMFLYGTSVSLFSNSIHINRNRVLTMAELLIPRIVEGVYMLGTQYINDLQTKYNESCHSETDQLQPPGTILSFLNSVKILKNSLIKRLFYKDSERWFLLYGKVNENSLYPDSFRNYRILKAPKNKYWADPFVVRKDDKIYIFVEEYLYSMGKAHIALLSLNENGRYKYQGTILEKPFHLSYPFIFSFKGDFYMIPETKSERSIQLYRGDPFPDRWSYVMDIMNNVAAADTTLFHYDNKWWLFTSIDELQKKDISYSELFLFYSDDLFSGNWISHPSNPVVTEIGKSRPAGKIFEYEGMLIRPSQDCSGGYGKAVNFNQIITMDTVEYKERIVDRIEPLWDKRLSGLHTFNREGNFCVIDVCAIRKRFFD